MVHALNIAKLFVLLQPADALSNDESLQVDTDVFKQHLFGSEGKAAFKKDLQETKYFGINRFP